MYKACSKSNSINGCGQQNFAPKLYLKNDYIKFSSNDYQLLEKKKTVVRNPIDVIAVPEIHSCICKNVDTIKKAGRKPGFSYLTE